MPRRHRSAEGEPRRLMHCGNRVRFHENECVTLILGNPREINSSDGTESWISNRQSAFLPCRKLVIQPHRNAIWSDRSHRSYIGFGSGCRRTSNLLTATQGDLFTVR